MRKFFKEFGTFIKRGNVLDLAVGVIIGGAFTAIVNALSNQILRPIINWILSLILKPEGLEGAVTMLSPVLTPEGTIDMAKSIYIDWGTFISAIINFLLIALVLFFIIKTINNIQESNEKMSNKIKKYKLSKEDKAELKKRGIKLRNKDGVDAYLKEKQEKIEEEKRIAEQKALEEKANNPTVEQLLKDIKNILAERK